MNNVLSKLDKDPILEILEAKGVEVEAWSPEAGLWIAVLTLGTCWWVEYAESEPLAIARAAARMGLSEMEWSARTSQGRRMLFNHP